MLLQILTNPRPEKYDAVDELYDCHERIRHYLALARRISTAQHAPDAEVRDAAGSLIRYFSKAYPLHVVDEDLSLIPRLKNTSPPPEVLSAIRALHEDHADLEPVVDAFCDAMQLLVDRPDRLTALQSRLAPMVDVLTEELEEHLAVEEDVLLPYARIALTPEMLGTIAREMHHRRAE